MATAYQSEQIDQLAMALAKAQAEIDNPAKNRENPHFRSSYADLAAVLNACRKPLATFGLSVVQGVTGEHDRPMLRTTLLHASGQWICGEVPLVGDLTKPQALGSLITYMRRYSLAAIAGVAQEDDDGHAAQGYDQAPPARNYSGGSQSPPPPARSNGNGDGAPRREFAPSAAGEMPRDGKKLWGWCLDRRKEGHENIIDSVNSVIEATFKRKMKMTEMTPEQVAAIWPMIAGSANGGNDDESEEQIPF